MNRYLIRAAHVAEKFKLKEIRDRIPHPIETFTNYELVIRYGVDSYAFVYNYGSVVFFNVPDALQEEELKIIRETKEGSGIGDTSDVFAVEESPALENATNQIFYDRVVVSKLTPQKIKIVCMLVAESTALEYYEILIENLLERATHYTKKLEQRGKFFESKDDLLRFAGMCLSTKQEIISNLYIVDSPDEIWESPELDKIYHDLKLMFDVDVRYRALDYKSKIIQESVEVIVDLVKSKRGMLLEMMIIALIAFEIVMSFVRHT